MVDIKLAYAFVQAIRDGSMLTIVGDVDQLPSVGSGQVLRDLIESGTIPTARLQTVHRQGKDSGIVVAAHAINSGRHPFDGADKELNGFMIEPEDEADRVADRIVELMATVLPAHGYDALRDVQVLSPTRRFETGIERLNDAIKARLNPYVEGDRRSITLRNRKFTVGDRVMHVRNDYVKGVYNGEVGTVTSCGMREGKNAKEPFIKVDYSGEEIDYSSQDVDDVEQSWAATVHKSQGCEFPVVVLALNSAQQFMLTRNLVYTAITRAKQLCIVIGMDGVIARAAANVDKDARHTGLKQMLAREFDRRREEAPAYHPGRMSGFIGIEE
jgi:exodeoxyribonuclease V alpha subunit